MIITLCYSMQYAERAEEIKKQLEARGITAFVSGTNTKYLGLTDADKEKLKLVEKYEHDAIRDHYTLINQSDAILVINEEKNNIPGYIGGNAFLEIGFAYILRKLIYLLNPIPHMPYYETEIIAMKPIILEGRLENIPA